MFAYNSGTLLRRKGRDSECRYVKTRTQGSSKCLREKHMPTLTEYFCISGRSGSAPAYLCVVLWKKTL